METNIDVIEVSPKPNKTIQTLQKNQSFIEKINFKNLNSTTIIQLLVLLIEIIVGIIEGFIMKKCD